MIISSQLRWEICHQYSDLYTNYYRERIENSSTFKTLTILRIFNNILTLLMIIIIVVIKKMEMVYMIFFEMRQEEDDDGIIESFSMYC